MKILVTGANGYIGSKVVKRLLDNRHQVICLDISDTCIDSRATFIKTNIFDENINFFELAGSPDVCLHMAWRDGFVHQSPHHMGDLSAHYKFLCGLIDAGLQQVAVMGSMHEVGYYEGAIDENTPCNPQSLYGVAKNALRKAMEIYCKGKCIFQWLRGFYIYGDDDTGSSIFAKLRQAAQRGEKSFPFTSGKNKYDFIHIDKLASQIADCVTQRGIDGIINCCSGKPVSLAEQVESYIQENHLNIKLDYGKYPDRPYDSPCIYGDDQKIIAILSSKLF